jgi:hypothetical protein
MGHDHFTMDGALIAAWASLKGPVGHGKPIAAWNHLWSE